MKLLYLSDSTIPSRSANSVHVMKMCAAMGNTGVEATLFAKQGVTLEEDVFANYAVAKSFTLKRLPGGTGKIGTLWYNVQCARHLWHTSQETIIYGRSVLGIYLALLLGFRTVSLELHQPPMSRIRQWLLRRIFTHQHFSYLIVITHSLKHYYYEKFSLAAEKIHVLPDGADPISLDSNTKNPFPTTHGLVVTYTGHLYPGKGMEILLPFATRCPTTQFNVVGGTEQDILYWKTQSPSPNVHFYGFVPQSALPNYLAHSDVLIAPYSPKVAPAGGGEDIARWMSPLKIFEYMATGKAILCSDLPVLREVLSNNETALLCDPENIDDWVAALRKLKNSQFRSEIGTKAQKKFLTSYTWLKRAEKLKLLLY